jgi:hypothetical protein
MALRGVVPADQAPHKVLKKQSELEIDEELEPPRKSKERAREG